VFDAKKVKGTHRAPRPQRARPSSALDGKTYALDDSNCVIADDNGVESIAGIMGGEASGCDETTTDVLIESALWDPNNIARTGRKPRHQFGCALSLRARRRSGLHGAGPRTRNQAGDGSVRRHALGGHVSRRDPMVTTASSSSR
jgi:hypothetical protein